MVVSVSGCIKSGSLQVLPSTKPHKHKASLILEKAVGAGFSRISTQLLFVGAILAFLAVANGAFMIHETASLQNDAQIINSMGIVRGSIQRAAKLEAAKAPSDEVVEQIDAVLERFISEERGYSLVGDKTEFSDMARELSLNWKSAKKALAAFRADPSEVNRKHLVDITEKCWQLANDAVYHAQLTSESKLERFRRVFLLIGINILGILIILWLVKRYVRNRLEHLAHHDPLTGLNNRYSYQLAMDFEMNKANRYGHGFSLIILDIDFFKSVNDAHGHKTGDRVLIELAGILKSSIRNTDHLARIGGEEFAVIAPFADLDDAKSLAEKIRMNVKEYIFPEAGFLTVSLGAAEFRENDDSDKLFNRADAALYAAKEAGRDRVAAV